MKKKRLPGISVCSFSFTITLLSNLFPVFPSAWAIPANELQVREQIGKLLAMPVAFHITASPKAQNFAWVEKRNGVRNIFISNNKKTEKVTSYIHDDGTDLWGLTFSEDGQNLAYVEGGDPEYPDDPAPDPSFSQPSPHENIHVILPDRRNIMLGEGRDPIFSPKGDLLAFVHQGNIYLASPAGPAHLVASLKGNIASLSWSPDGKKLLFSINRDTHAFIGIWSIREKEFEFLDPVFALDSLPAFSPDGKYIAFIREHHPIPDNSGKGASFWKLYVYDLEQHHGHAIWKAPSGVGSQFFAPEGYGIAWSDNTHILFPWEGSGWLRLCSIGLSETSPNCLTPDQSEISSYSLSSDKKTLFYISNFGNLDSWHAWKRPLNSTVPERLVHDDKHMETSLAVAEDSVGLLSVSAIEPAHPLIIGNNNFSSYKYLSPQETIKFIDPQNVIFHSLDGNLVHGQLFLPQHSLDIKHAALIFVHGGPERQMLSAFNGMGYYSNAYIMNQILANQGYIVLSVNYRSGTGYGEAFRNAPNVGRSGASEYQDIEAAALWLKKRSDVDSQHIGIWGGSWGGYLTALALARNSNIFAAGADFHGVHDMVEPDQFGLSPEQNKAAHELEWKSSPIADIVHWRSPVLLVHGDDDYNVGFRQSVLLGNALDTHGISYEEHAFPNERHAFLRTENWLSAYVWMDMFFDKFLKIKSN